MESKWNIIEECNGDDGEPTCWAKEISHPDYGRYAWISLNGKEKFDVEIMQDNDVKVLATCRSLASAKRWVSMHLG